MRFCGWFRLTFRLDGGRGAIAGAAGKAAMGWSGAAGAADCGAAAAIAGAAGAGCCGGCGSAAASLEQPAASVEKTANNSNADMMRLNLINWDSQISKCGQTA